MENSKSDAYKGILVSDAEELCRSITGCVFTPDDNFYVISLLL